MKKNMKLVMALILTTIFTLSLESSFAQGKKSKGKVKIKYRKNEKFDLDELSIEGDSASPGDLSVTQRYRAKYRNKLPYRFNFNPELRNAVEAIR